MTINQISIFVENKPGMIADVTRTLAEVNVDIRALTVADTADFGILRLLVSDTQKAKEALKKSHKVAQITEVVAVAVPDVPGGLASVLTLLDEEHINIEYMYSLIGRGEKMAYMVFRVSAPNLLSDILEKNGISLISKEELGIV